MRITSCCATAALATALGSIALPRDGFAQSFAQRFTLHGEVGADWMLGGTQAREFGTGVHGVGRLGFQIVGPLSIQAGVGNWWYASGDSRAPLGRVTQIGGGLRVHPVFGAGALGGPVLDANAGVALTGGLTRFMFDVGLGWEFQVHSAVGVGPMVRYAHVLQPDDEAFPDDAMSIAVGVGLTVRLPRGERGPAQAGPLDTDNDGMEDHVDRCPLNAEDRDGFRDDDGCPEPDNDNDNITDRSDSCPLIAETHNGFQDADGCPDEAPARRVATIRDNQIIISNTVPFEFDSDQLQEGAGPILNEVVEVLRQHPEIRRIRVEGHADFRGSPAHNTELSTRRAAAVAAYLREHDAGQAQIESQGYGSERRVCTEDTEACHGRNRRVEFVIVEGPGAAPAGGAR